MQSFLKTAYSVTITTYLVNTAAVHLFAISAPSVQSLPLSAAMNPLQTKPNSMTSSAAAMQKKMQQREQKNDYHSNYKCKKLSGNNHARLEVTEVAELFQGFPNAGWDYFASDRTTWDEREDIADYLRKNSSNGWANFLDLYRKRMEFYIDEEFYELCNNKRRMNELTIQYSTGGEVSVNFLRKECLPQLARWSLNKEPHGRNRYGIPRTVYPPGEVKLWNHDDVRKGLKSEVHMVAIGHKLMQQEDEIQWIYHLPHLRVFIQQIMQFSNELYTYESELGIAVNVMRPPGTAMQALANTAVGEAHNAKLTSSIETETASSVSQNTEKEGVKKANGQGNGNGLSTGNAHGFQNAKTSLGFHFDSIDSSTSSPLLSAAKSQQHQQQQQQKLYVAEGETKRRRKGSWDWCHAVQSGATGIAGGDSCSDGAGDSSPSSPASSSPSTSGIIDVSNGSGKSAAAGSNTSSHNSSNTSSNTSSSSSSSTAGATGVIGIQDCDAGGERITFETIDRSNVCAVQAVLEQFSPDDPHKPILYHPEGAKPGADLVPIVPSVRDEPVAGVLSIFNGGNRLHGVSAVKRGVRSAAVFLFPDRRPDELTLKSANASANAFYGAQ